MRVKMKSIYAGPTGNYQPGDVAGLPGKEAKALIAGGFAVDAEVKRERQATPTSTATAAGAETAPAPAGQTATAPASETAGN